MYKYVIRSTSSTSIQGGAEWGTSTSTCRSSLRRILVPFLALWWCCPLTQPLRSRWTFTPIGFVSFFYKSLEEGRSWHSSETPLKPGAARGFRFKMMLRDVLFLDLALYVATMNVGPSWTQPMRTSADLSGKCLSPARAPAMCANRSLGLRDRVGTPRTPIASRTALCVEDRYHQDAHQQGPAFLGDTPSSNGNMVLQVSSQQHCCTRTHPFWERAARADQAHRAADRTQPIWCQPRCSGEGVPWGYEP